MAAREPPAWRHRSLPSSPLYARTSAAIAGGGGARAAAPASSSSSSPPPVRRRNHGSSRFAAATAPVMIASPSEPQHQESSTADQQPQPSLQRSLRALPSFARELLAGGVAGGIAKSAVAPLERTKILFQTRGPAVAEGGILGTLAFIRRTEGARGLFKGNGASVLRIVPYAAIHFGCYEGYRRAASDYWAQLEGKEREEEEAWWEEVAAAALAAVAGGAEGGGASGGLSGEAAAARDEARPHHPHHHHAHAHAPYSTTTASTALMPSPDASSPFSRAQAEHRHRASAEAVAASAAAFHEAARAHRRAEAAAAAASWPVWDLIAGSASGATAVLSTYPLDLVRTRLAWATEAAASSAAVATPAGGQPSSGRPRPTTIRSVLARTLREEGVMGLYRGVVPTLLGILPYAGLKFYVYQSLKGWWRAREAEAARAAAEEDEERRRQLGVLGLAGAGGAGGAAEAAASPAEGGGSQDAAGSPQQQQPSTTTRQGGGGGGGAAAAAVAAAAAALQQHREREQQEQQQQQRRTSSSSHSTLGGLAAGGAAAAAALGGDGGGGGAGHAASSSPAPAPSPADAAADPHTPSHKPARLPVHMMLLFGGISGLMAQTATYPLDVVRRQMQVQGQVALHAEEVGPAPRSAAAAASALGLTPGEAADAVASPSSRRGGAGWTLSGTRVSVAAAGVGAPRHLAEEGRLTMRDTLRRVAAEGGLARGLYRGLSLNYVKVVPSTAVGFAVYDWLKGYLDLQGNL